LVNRILSQRPLNSACSPTDGSIFGGTIVSVSGRGFTEEKVVQVFADDRDCIPIIGQVQFTEMNCTTTARPARIKPHGRWKAGRTGSPFINSLGAEKYSVVAGDRVTINGINFGAENTLNTVHVHVAGELYYYDVKSWTSNEIIAETVMLNAS